MMKKRFSIRYKLILIFGILVTVACITEGLVAIIIAHKAVTEKIQVHLMDKARDAAEILDGKVLQWFQLLEGIIQMPALRDSAVSYQEKAVYCNSLPNRITLFRS